MAVNKRGRHYKLTPRRKVAILKAQKASARKRRGKVARIAGAVGVVAVTGAAAGFAYKRMGRSRNNSTVGKELDIIRVAPRISQTKDGTRVFFDNVGQPLNRTALDNGRPQLKRRKRKLPNYVESEKRRLALIKRRETKNYKERRKYWQAKPVPKVPRKSRKKKR